MAKSSLSPVAELAAGLIRQSRDREIEAEYFEDKLNKERWEVVSALRELQEAGLGRFIPGRHSYKTRFAKAEASTIQNELNIEQDLGEEENHVFILKRASPIRIALPADLTRAEAERIVRWVTALPEQ